MTIGLVLLALLAILIFFGISERFFRSLGVSNWLAFLLVMALVVGAVVPSVTIKTFSLNVGGFLVPLVIMTVLMVLMRFGAEMARAISAMLSVAAIAVATRMLIEPTNGSLILASSLIVGFAGGMVAFLVGQSRLATLASAIGGIILGDLITNILYTYAFGTYPFTLGSYGVFDSIVIASIFGIMICEAVRAIKITAEKRAKRPKTAKTGLMTASNIEASEDSGMGDGMQKSADNNALSQEDGISVLDADLLEEGLISENMEAAEDNELLARLDGDEQEEDAFFDDYV